MTKLSKPAAIAIAIFAALSFSGLVSTPAFAANMYYANSVSTSENAVRSGGPYSSVSGGYAATEAFDVDGAPSQIHLETFRPRPGYVTLATASGAGSVRLVHRTFNNATQKCLWMWPWAGGNVGNLKLTCYAST